MSAETLHVHRALNSGLLSALKGLRAGIEAGQLQVSAEEVSRWVRSAEELVTACAEFEDLVTSCAVFVAAHHCSCERDGEHPGGPHESSCPVAVFERARECADFGEPRLTAMWDKGLRRAVLSKSSDGLWRGIERSWDCRCCLSWPDFGRRKLKRLESGEIVVVGDWPYRIPIGVDPPETVYRDIEAAEAMEIGWGQHRDQFLSDGLPQLMRRRTVPLAEGGQDEE